MKVRQVSGPRKPNAVAIIITISTIALVAVILISFLSVSRIELKSANTDSKVKEAKSHSESATNLVISQIRSATGRLNEAWASQPGSIRRWDQTGNFVAGHKLYSDSKMVEEGSEIRLSQDLPDPDWPVLKARYVDLNEPAVRIDDDGSLLSYFPIIDPRAAFPEGGGGYQDPGSVEGFGIDSNGTTGIVVANDHTARLPMPVEWLYILKDGTIGHLDESNVFVPSFIISHPINSLPFSNSSALYYLVRSRKHI